MERALRSFTSTLVLGLIVLAPTFTSGLVALRLPFLSTESIAAHSTLGRDRVVVQARARRATQGIRSRTTVPTQNPVYCAMASPNEGKAPTCMRSSSQQPHLPPCICFARVRLDVRH